MSDGFVSRKVGPSHLIKQVKVPWQARLHTQTENIIATLDSYVGENIAVHLAISGHNERSCRGSFQVMKVLLISGSLKPIGRIHFQAIGDGEDTLFLRKSIQGLGENF